MALADGSRTKHGFPRGYRFVPENLEIATLLSDRIRGRPLPPKVAGIFHDLRILDYHPRDLYEAYKEHEEYGFIYFFSLREFPAPGAGGRRGDSDKKKRPVRACRYAGGGWKPSGGGRELRRSRRNGGGVAGKMVTMVFYDREDCGIVKTGWGMHEFTVLVGPEKFSDLAVYRLYKLKNGGKESKKAAWHANKQANGSDHRVATVSVECKPSTSTAVAPLLGQPTGMFTTNQVLAAASTSQMPLQPSIGPRPHNHQYAFGAAATPGPSTWAPPGTANPQAQQAHATPVHGAGLPDHFHFAGPPAPVPVAPAAANPAAQQTPATAMHGTGQAGHSGATRSPSTTPAAVTPPAEQHSAPVSPPHVQSAVWDEPTEAGGPSLLEVVPPPPELALAAEDACIDDVWNERWRDMPGLSMHTGLTSLDDFFMYDGSCDLTFTMEELTGPMFVPPPEMPTPMERDDPFGGDENNQAGGKQEPQATLV